MTIPIPMGIKLKPKSPNAKLLANETLHLYMWGFLLSAAYFGQILPQKST